jgi:hypothetical protein
LIDRDDKMRKSIVFLAVLIAFVSCKEEVVKEPDHLIEEGVMVDIMYDLVLFEAVKNNNPGSLSEYQINPNQYIYKKYKIDSLQFVQNNKYYASNYVEYKEMYDEIAKRLERNKKKVDSLVKIERKKTILLKMAKAKKAAKEKAKLHKVAIDSLKMKLRKK